MKIISYSDLWKKNNSHKLILIFGFIISWLTISFAPESLEVLINKNIFTNNVMTNSRPNFFNIINLLRGLSTLIYLPILIFLLLKYVVWKKITLKINIFFLITIYLFSQLIGLFVDDYQNSTLSSNDFLQIYYLLNSFIYILIVHLSLKIFDEKNFQIFFNIIFILLCLIFFIFSYKYFVNFFSGIENLYHSWGNSNKISSNLGFDIPRPTGLSRSALIIIIILHTYYKISINNKNLSIIFFSSIISVIFLLYSRGTFVMFFSFLVLYVLINYNKINLFKYLMLFAIYPLLIGLFLSITKIGAIKYSHYVFEKNKLIKINDCNDKEDSSTLNCRNLAVEENLVLKYLASNSDNYIKSIVRYQNKKDISSGRIQIWKDLITINDNVFFGYGVNADRRLIGKNASSLIMYTYITSGIFGLLIITAFSLMTLYYAFLLILKFNKRNNTLYFEACAYILIVLLIRSLFETSYGIFGIDFVLFTFCALTVEKKMKKFSNK
tara:strand:- start:327 stop:1811 length:1485 start_codon:yes stop_codon:yes gene_type:complete